MVNDFLQRIFVDVKQRGFRIDRTTFDAVFDTLAKLAHDRIWRFDTISLPGVGVILYDEGRLVFRPSEALKRTLSRLDNEIKTRQAELDKASINRDERTAAKDTQYSFFV